jgi:long-chain acyl-CoA synthetase
MLVGRNAVQTLGAMLESTARWFPNKPLIIFQGKAITYDDFNKSAARLAGVLSGLGVGPGVPVGIYLRSRPELAVAYHACQKIGAIAVPISASYKPNELEGLGRRTGMPALVCSSDSVPSVDAVRGELPKLKHVLVHGGSGPSWTISLDRELANCADHFEPVAVDAEAVAATFFTSGTTGSPKGAMQTHRSIYHALRDMHAHQKMRWNQERFMCALPLFNNFGATGMLNGSIYAAGTLILIERWDTQAILNLMAEHRATFFAGTPTMFTYLLRGYDPTKHDLASLRTCMAGGAPFPPDIMERFEKTFGVQLLNSYGATEVCGSCAFESPSGLRRRGSVGAAIGSASIDIQDDEGNSLPPGSRGEIVVSGDTVGAGYRQERDATAAAFTARGWRSGDLGELDENGLLYVLDRKKDLIITGGSNIFPSEVEAVLASHPAVKLAAVVGVPDALKGELAIGCVVPNDGATPSEEALLAYCKDRLAVYKIPRRIEFLQSVPLGPTGKILKRVLRDQIGEDAAD